MSRPAGGQGRSSDHLTGLMWALALEAQDLTRAVTALQHNQPAPTPARPAQEPAAAPTDRNPTSTPTGPHSPTQRPARNHPDTPRKTGLRHSPKLILLGPSQPPQQKHQ